MEVSQRFLSKISLQCRFELGNASWKYNSVQTLNDGFTHPYSFCSSDSCRSKHLSIIFFAYEIFRSVLLLLVNRDLRLRC